MVLVLLIICLILAVLNMVLFQASVGMSLAAILFCVAGIVLQLCKKKLPSRLGLALVIGCALLGFVLLWNAGGKTGKGGVAEYEERLIQVRELLEDGKLDKAVAALTELEELYGSDDNTQVLWAMENLVKKNYEKAYEAMYQVQDKTSQIYYAVMEQICIADPSAESVETIYEMYIEAAEQWPYWTHMQKYAGISLFEQNDYAQAKYYLLRAYQQDETDFRVAYYLGAVAFYQNDADECRSYFNEALKLGADDETKGNIVWYVQQLEER